MRDIAELRALTEPRIAQYFESDRQVDDIRLLAQSAVVSAGTKEFARGWTEGWNAAVNAMENKS